MGLDDSADHSVVVAIVSVELELLDVAGDHLRARGSRQRGVAAIASQHGAIDLRSAEQRQACDQPGTGVPTVSRDTRLAGNSGVVVVLIGSAILTSEPSRDRHATVTREQRRRGIQDRLLAVLLTAIASVFLKKAMESANAWQVLSAWCMLCWVIAFAWQLVYSLHHWQQNSPQNSQQNRGQAADYLPDASLPAATTTRPPHWLRATYATYQRDKAAIFMVAVGMLVMQGCTIGLFARMPVGYALALFQAGSLVSVIVGHKLLGEGHVVRRLAAATIMVIGATMIIFAG